MLTSRRTLINQPPANERPFDCSKVMGVSCSPVPPSPANEATRGVHIAHEGATGRDPDTNTASRLWPSGHDARGRAHSTVVYTRRHGIRFIDCWMTHLQAESNKEEEEEEGEEEGRRHGLAPRRSSLGQWCSSISPSTFPSCDAPAPCHSGFSPSASPASFGVCLGFGVWGLRCRV